MNWHKDFLDNGYMIFPKLMPQPLVDAAYTAITVDMRDNYDPDRFEEYDSISYCPDLCLSEPVMSLLKKSPVWKLLEEAFGVDNFVHGRGQIAIRQAHNHDEELVYDYHLDGVPNGKNGVIGNNIDNFTALIGVFLNDIPHHYRGNLAVWPGSHYLIETYFREQGPKAMSMGRPDVKLGDPVQINASAGDVILCHYGLAHSIASNRSDTNRIAVYFRIAVKGLAQRRWAYLTNIWEGWKFAPARAAWPSVE